MDLELERKVRLSSVLHFAGFKPCFSLLATKALVSIKVSIASSQALFMDQRYPKHFFLHVLIITTQVAQG
jgi:hypothetical protein